MDLEQALHEYQKYLSRNYRKKTTQRNYYKSVKKALHWFKEHKNITDSDTVTREDLEDWRAYCNEHYKQNGNVSRFNALNNFFVHFQGKKDYKISVPASIRANKHVMNKDELITYIRAAETPLEKMVVLLQIDGLLRPSEIARIKIGNLDLENHRLYLDDTKTGNNYIIISPRLTDSIQTYLGTRRQPRDIKDLDMLIIMKTGRYAGYAPKDAHSFVYGMTKRLAARAGFTRNIYPYLIKPSVITNDLNEHVNPKIVQRKARHKRIESTLRYDHTSDEMLVEHFHSQHEPVSVTTESNYEDMARVLLDKLLAGEIDNGTFKKSLDILAPTKNTPKKHTRDLAYG